eukprot:s3746_g5.t1
MQCRQCPPADLVALSRRLKGQAWEEALHLFSVAQTSRVQPDIVAFNSLLRCTPWVLSMQLFQDLLPLRPDIVSLSTVMKSCTDRSLWRPSVTLLASAEALGVEVDRVATNSLMFAFCQGQRTRRWHLFNLFA